ERLLAAMGIDPREPATWEGKGASADPAVLALTEPCRTDAVETVVEQLAGPRFLRGLAFSPYLEARGVAEPMIRGYIPVLRFPEPVPVSGAAGDVILMHYLTVHSGSANRSGHIRMGLNTAVLPDPAHPYQRKSGPPRPDWTPLDRTLRTDDL